MKILDKINKLLEDDKLNANNSPKSIFEGSPHTKGEISVPKTWYSYEYFPPKTVAGK